MGKNDLVSIGSRTTEEQQEICSKGGIASGEARRKKRSIRTAAQLILSLPVKDLDTIEALKRAGIEDPEDMNNLEAMVAVAAAKAKAGDLKAMQFLRDAIGENPQWSAYRERTKELQKAQDTTTALVDDWINSVMD